MYRLPFVIVCQCSLLTSSSYSPGRSRFRCLHSASGVFLLTVFALKYPPPHPTPPPIRLCCLMGRASLLWLLPAGSSSYCVPQCILHRTLSHTIKRLIVEMRSDLNSRNLQCSASLFVYRQLLHRIANYEGWNFNSGNYLFTTDTK